MKSIPIEVQTGLRYWRGELASTPISGDFRPSRKEDVFDVFNDMKAADAVRYEKLAIHSIRNGEGVFSVLAAGASSRMNTRKAPPAVRKLLGKGKILSKAAVPIGTADGKPLTYLSEFGFNLSRLLHLVHKESVRSGLASLTDANDLLIFSNPAYLKEHKNILSQNLRYGLSEDQIRFVLQPLGPKFWASPEDVRRLEGKVGPGTLRKMLDRARSMEKRIARQHGSVIVPGEREPLGHGEYFHQMIASGEVLRWAETGKRWIFVRNIDNCAAKLDRVWLRILGYFLHRGLDFQVEVSPRAIGQTGGALIVMKETGSHQIAEDPNILATNRARGHIMNPADSYWFNDATALFTPRYVLGLYKENGQSDEEFLSELRKASKAEREKIASRGRLRFPSILDVKPARKIAAATVKRETNLWQSTGLVPDEIRVKAIGVRNARQYDGDFSKLRFLSTKQWFLDESVVSAARRKMSLQTGRRITRSEALLSLETYAGNRPLFTELIRYNRAAKLVPPGVLKKRGR